METERRQQQEPQHSPQWQNYETQLERVFVYYCSFADKENIQLLKVHNWRRLLSDMRIPPEGIQSHLDLIFCSYSHSNGLNKPHFQKALADVANLVFAEGTPPEKLQKLLARHFQPLYDVVMRDTEFGHSLSLVSLDVLTQGCFLFLKRFEEGLSSLYRVYFNHESHSGETQQFKFFSNMCRELSLVPRVVNKPVSYLLFVFLRQKQSKSAFEVFFTGDRDRYGFSFVVFLEFVIVLAHIHFQQEPNQIRKLYSLLQIIEVSPGVTKLAKTTRFQHFYLTEGQLAAALQPKARPIAFNRVKPTLTPPRVGENPLRQQLGAYFESLTAKFAQLCNRRRAESNFYLPSSSASRLLKTVCPALTGTSISQLVGSIGRINFDGFVWLLRLASQATKVPLEQLFELVLAYNTEQFNIGLLLSGSVLAEQQQMVCRQVLRQVQPYLRSIYNYYQSSKTLPLDNYIRCLQETGVMPQIIKPKEANHIYTACTIRGQTMNFEEFLDSFIAITVAVHFDCDLQGAERLIYLLEKVCESKRGEILMKKNLLLVKEHPLYLVRLTFAATYRQIEAKIQSTRVKVADPLKIVEC